MKTVGEVLKTRRLERHLSLEEIAQATKIKKEFLSHIEANHFAPFSSLVTAKGFIKNYAEYLDLSANDVLAIFRRDNLPAKKKSQGFNLFRSIGNFNINWTPKFSLGLVIFVFILGILMYLSWQYFRLRQTPRLEISAPKDKQEVFQEKITVLGKSDPEALVKINETLVTLSPKGEFSLELTLFPGENKIFVEAVSKFGRKTSQELTVFRQ